MEYREKHEANKKELEHIGKELDKHRRNLTQLKNKFQPYQDSPEFTRDPQQLESLLASLVVELNEITQQGNYLVEKFEVCNQKDEEITDGIQKLEQRAEELKSLIEQNEASYDPAQWIVQQLQGLVQDLENLPGRQPRVSQSPQQSQEQWTDLPSRVMDSHTAAMGKRKETIKRQETQQQKQKKVTDLSPQVTATHDAAMKNRKETIRKREAQRQQNPPQL